MTFRHCWISLILLACGCSQGTPLGVDSKDESHFASHLAETPTLPRVESPDVVNLPSLDVTKPASDCARLSSAQASNFTGLKIRLRPEGNDDWIYLPLISLEQRRDLQDKSLLITGYVGKNGISLVCSRLQAAGFVAVNFIEDASQVSAVDSYQSLLLLENPLPKFAIISTAEEKTLLGGLGNHIRLINVNELSDPLISALLQVKTRDECQDIFVTRSTWQARTAAAPKHQLSNQCHVVVMPDTALIKAELDRQRTANIKRNMPLEKYKCET